MAFDCGTAARVEGTAQQCVWDTSAVCVGLEHEHERAVRVHPTAAFLRCLSKDARNYATEPYQTHGTAYCILHHPHRDVLVVVHRIRAGHEAVQRGSHRLPPRGEATDAGMKASVVTKTNSKRFNGPTMILSLFEIQGGTCGYREISV